MWGRAVRPLASSVRKSNCAALQLRCVAAAASACQSQVVSLRITRFTSSTSRSFSNSAIYLNLNMIEAPFGSWASPITSQLATDRSVSFQEVHVEKATGFGDVVFWSELRSDEGGRCVVCSCKFGESSFTAWTPEGFNARSAVHEYGGGAFWVHAGSVYFSNFSDHRLYVQKSAGDAPTALTPENCGFRYADGDYVIKHDHLVCVREDHSGVDKGEWTEPVNTVVAINVKTQQQMILASGADFYARPRVTEDGTKICWMQWDHPNMPWDDTDICIADLNMESDQLVTSNIKKVAGGVGVSAMYPRWLASNELTYISDITDWWNLYVMRADGSHINLHKASEEIGGPLWVFGENAYDMNRAGKIVANYGGSLAILDMKSESYTPIDTEYTSYEYIQCSGNEHVYCVLGSPTQFPFVARINITNGKIDVIRESRSVPVDKAYLTVPEAVSWTTGNDHTAYGYFYPAKNKDYTGIAGTLPPLLVRVHGGPTARFSDGLTLSNQYYTSRGISILCVNNRGSTGYGRAYRNLLYENWGIYDIEDCCTGAKSLADRGVIDGNKLCIDGGSAGGYSTLACLAFKDTFAAGASRYGIGDLESLASDTHKFESRYIGRLLLPLEPENIWLYEQRSPIKHIDQFNCPIVLFQGDEDKVVLPNQAEMMFDAVKAKGLPCAYVLFKGEQHGFRNAENIQKTLDGTLYFFGKVFGYEPADDKGHLEICNLPG